MESKFFLAAAGILGFLGVALGAFGAHILQSYISEKMMETYKTGILYHLIHTAVLLALALYGNAKFSAAGIFFIVGIILFSFSLYLYSFTEIKAFAMITPFGGISLLIGWGLIVYNSFRTF